MNDWNHITFIGVLSVKYESIKCMQALRPFIQSDNRRHLPYFYLFILLHFWKMFGNISPNGEGKSSSLLDK